MGQLRISPLDGLICFYFYSKITIHSEKLKTLIYRNVQNLINTIKANESLNVEWVNEPMNQWMVKNTKANSYERNTNSKKMWQKINFALTEVKHKLCVQSIILNVVEALLKQSLTSTTCCIVYSRNDLGK